MNRPAVIPQLPLLRRVVGEQPYPLLFATVSGAHLYGFASPDSDFDLRGVHVLPARDVLGLAPTRDTISDESERDGVEIDLVTHDAAKFFRLLLRKNGYVLEQLYSPLVVATSPAHEELKAVARGCVTRFHVHHYLGFADTQWKLFNKLDPPKVKPLLYVYRVLLTGIHLMRTGEVEANLLTLNDEAELAWVDDLIAQKHAGPEQQTLAAVDVSFHARQYELLRAELEAAGAASTLPDRPSAGPALSDLLVRLRLG